jgi:hypothetical protein
VRKLNVLELRWCVISMILPICAALLTLPFAPLAFGDDWTYVYTALRYAQSGSIQYNGWSEPLAIFQAIYGGALIRLFGFSFNLLRIATITIASGCSGLIYLLCRRAELPPPVSLFASLTATISPLFIALAASFLTDVYGCFFFLLCILLGIRAIDSAKPFNTSIWLFASIVTGLIGGADRQISWVGLVAVLACFVWEKRKVPYLVLLAGLLATMSGLAIVELLRWYTRQPNAVVDTPAWQDMTRNALLLPRFAVKYFLSAILLCLPSLLLLLPSFIRLSRRGLRLALAAALVYTGVGFRHPFLLAPWLDNTVTPYGIFRPHQVLIGDKTPVLGIVSRAVLTMFVLFIICVLAHFIVLWLSRFLSVRTKTAVFETSRMRSFVALLTISLLGCLGLVAVRSLTGLAYDHYLLPWLPLFLILLTRALCRPGVEPKWRFGWAALVVFAAYGVGATHDYWAASRARVRAAEILEAAGVSRRHIDGGFDWNGWTQLMDEGYICRSDARPPSGGSACPQTPDEWFRSVTPIVDPQYFLAFSPVPGLVSSRFAPVSYCAWMPPFRRQVLTLTHE